MLMRLFYTSTMAWKYRHHLRKIHQETTENSPQTLPLAELKQQGIKTVVFDFDGVLAHHGADQPIPDMIPILKNSIELFGPNQIYILSNKPSAIRAAFFKTLPGITFVVGKRKKPFPDGLEKIKVLSGSSPKQILLIDDRLLTGMLACSIAGVTPFYINHPLVNLHERPLTESFFKCLRFLERQLF